VLNPQASRTYYVTVGTAICPGNFRDSVQVTVPAPPFVSADTTNSPGGLFYCTDLPGVTLQADVQASGSFFVSWSPTTGLISPNVLQPLANPRQATFYVLTVFNGGCTYRDTVLVTPLPGNRADITQEDTIICRGTSIPLLVKGGLGSATIRWTPTTGLSNPNIANPIASPTRRTKYYAELDEAGCTSIDSVTIDVADQPIARFGVSPDLVACNTYTLTFLDSSTSAVQLLWDFGDGSAQVPKSFAPRHTYRNPGVYTARLFVDGPQGYCKDTAERIIRVVPGPQIAATASVSPGESVYLPNAIVQFDDNTAGAVSWLWFFGDGSNSTQQRPQHLYTEVNDTGYRPIVIVQDVNGCLDTLQLGPIRVLPPFLAETPNVFTPNGDNINDRFAIPYEGSDRYTLQIFDRYGQRVFETINPLMGWNGKLNNVDEEVTDGVYFWVLKVGVRRFQGNVTLLR
jgi:gliding motility-associated-like protein